MNRNTTQEDNLEKNIETLADSQNQAGNEEVAPQGGGVTDGLEGDSERIESEAAKPENQESSVEELLKEELEKLRGEMENYRDSWQRERAEFINYKRRTAHELLNARTEAVRSFIHGLLQPLDNLELVTNTKTENQELKAFIEGVAMIKKELLGVMEKEGVKKLIPLGEPFDPMIMEAISSEESEEYAEEKVIEVYQPGYYFMEGENKHAIRPARVKVGKPLSTHSS